MRCFLAIPLSDEIKDYLFLLMRDIKKEFKKYNLKASFAPKKNLHITLIFLGEITDGKIDKIKNSISGLKIKPFKFKIKTLGIFPNENLIRVLWAGIEPDKDVIKLQKNIDESLLDVLGLKRDHEFGAHITLARIKESKYNIKISSFIKKVKLKEIEQSVDSFCLYRSELQKDGAKYFLLEKFNFA